MKNAMKKLMSLVLVAILLVSAVPFAASASTYTASLEVKYEGEDAFYGPAEVAIQYENGTTAQSMLNAYITNEYEGVKKVYIRKDGNVLYNGDDANQIVPNGYSVSIVVGKKAAPTETTPDPTETTPAPTETQPPVVRKDITWQLKYAEGSNVIQTNSFTPNGELANAKDILYYHVFNRSNDWQNDYECTKVWSSLRQADVGYNGQVPEGDTVTFVLTAKNAPACTTHTYDNGVITKPATTDSTGIKTYTCTACGATKEEILPKTSVSIPSTDKPMVILDLNYQGSQNYYIELNSTIVTWANVLPLIENQYGTFTRDNFVFAGWYWDSNYNYPCKNNELVSTKAVDQVTIYAKWSVPQNTPRTLLYLHTDTGIKDDPYDVTGYTTTDGKIDIYEVMKYVRKLYSFTSYSGLYTDESWTTQQYVTTESITVNKDDLTIIHVNIVGAKPLGSSSSTTTGSSSTADSSNPKTGDTIFAPLFVLGLSASALAVMFYLNKKRAF